MTIRMPNLCASCKHLDRASYNAGGDVPVVCEAFPREIPEDIVVHGGDHRKHIKGDHGITYEKDPLRANAYKIWKRFHDKREKEKKENPEPEFENDRDDDDPETQLSNFLERVQNGEDPKTVAWEMINDADE